MSSTTATPTAIPASTPSLTTPLTFPPDCTAPSAWSSTRWANNQIAYQLDSGVHQYTCYPPRYSSLQYEGSGWYSPGVCPASWEYVATSVMTGDLGVVRTGVVCCPEGMHTWGDKFSCTQVITSGGKLTFSETGDGATAFANPVSVMWEEKDLSLFQPASAPVLALSSMGVTFPASTASTSFPSLIPSSTGKGFGGAPATSGTAGGTSTGSGDSSSSDSGLATGAAAGVGVGATVGGLALIAGIWWLVRKNWKVSRREPSIEKGAGYEQAGGMDEGSPDEGLEGMPHYAQQPAVIAEAPNDTVRHEVAADTYRAELDGGWYASEVDGVRSPK
ncbi:uncharacterized protein LTR77_004573 [Saxophila tyrrhenica]|uniref:Uncharacterized protein n=1 Tax=Saxophila tyrrhenica TaxID=1690608 RepID=A0AAV9PFN7_9PEZI|nr:hypothetical protein LTR77_004573 [Saxophila tyrrhenica]